MDGNSLEREDIENVDRGIWCQPDGGVKEVAIKYVRPAQQREQSFYMVNMHGLPTRALRPAYRCPHRELQEK